MTLTAEERKALVIYRAQRAITALEEARDNARLNHWNLVTNRLYYATYYAQTSYLLERGYVATSHAGVKSLINLYCVKEGIISGMENALLKRLFAMRQTGDYEDCYDWTKEDVEPLIPEVEALVKKFIAFSKIVNEENIKP